MHPTRRRILGTTALAIPFSTILIHGALRNDNMSLWGMLGTTAVVALTFYFMWPMFEYLWQERRPGALTWHHVAGMSAAGILLTIGVVLGGRWFGVEIDAWLVLACVMLGVMYSIVGEWEDGTIRGRIRSRG